MKFFFADSQDFVDPDFNFTTEERSSERVRQRRDVYAHELFSTPPYDGVLVSKGIVDGSGSAAGKYSIAQRNRLLALGVRRFLRLDEHESTKHLATMGDCGAFSYVREETPPFTVDDVVGFYEQCGFDVGVSLDHVILAQDESLDTVQALPAFDDESQKWRHRQEITLSLARDFWARTCNKQVGFIPMAVAQGWSPRSYQKAVAELQAIGYNRIAIGGLVPVRTKDIVAVLEAVAQVRLPGTQFHLLGVTRLEKLASFESWGVTSFDTTSPLRQAFKDDKDNYYADDRTYVAIRVPQVDGNAQLKRAILSGRVDGRLARKLEKNTLNILAAYDAGRAAVSDAHDAVMEYAALYDPSTDRGMSYLDTLADKPWKQCGCDVCRDVGINVVLFRGAERNRRRGFHNLYVFYNLLKRGKASARVKALQG